MLTACVGHTCVGDAAIGAVELEQALNTIEAASSLLRVVNTLLSVLYPLHITIEKTCILNTFRHVIHLQWISTNKSLSR